MNKKLVIDTNYKYIRSFNNGVAVAEMSLEYEDTIDRPDDPRFLNEIVKDSFCMIDTTGKIIVPYGQYKRISAYRNGYATVEITKGDSTYSGLINRNGRLLFVKPDSELWDFDIDGFFFSRGVSAAKLEGYEGYIDTNGKVVFDDPYCRVATKFSYGRAFIQKGGGDLLINRKFHRVGNDTFNKFTLWRPGFENGYCIVEKNKKRGIIDTNGKFLVQPHYAGIKDIADGCFFFAEDVSEAKTLFGIADLKDKVLVKPIFTKYDRNGFVDGLIKGVVNNKVVYVNMHGNIVWREGASALRGLTNLNIDFMREGKPYVISSSDTDNKYDKKYPDRFPLTIRNDRFQKNALSIFIDTNSADTFAGVYKGIKVFVANTTNDTAAFASQGGRLYLTMQALDKNGQWKDLEYLPGSSCGTAYDSVTLCPNNYWQLTFPRYGGVLKTKIRVALDAINMKGVGETIYSNVIDANINPAQMWNHKVDFSYGKVVLPCKVSAGGIGSDYLPLSSFTNLGWGD